VIPTLGEPSRIGAAAATVGPEAVERLAFDGGVATSSPISPASARAARGADRAGEAFAIRVAERGFLFRRIEFCVSVRRAPRVGVRGRRDPAGRAVARRMLEGMR